MILSVEKLSHSYGVRTLFKDVTFNIEMGDKIGIIGVNGTGKSTLLRDIARGEAGDGGRITANGSCVIEYLPQNPDYDPQATVLEQVFQGDSPQLELLRRYERAVALAAADPENSALQSRLLELQQQMDSAYAWQLESEAKAVLDQLGISDFNQPMAELSGGQRKRVALAGVLVRPSDLLILDEPTNGLDPAGIQEMRSLIASMPQTTGATVLISSHLLGEIEQMVDQVGILNHGRLLFEGSLQQLQKHSRGGILLRVLDAPKAAAVLQQQGVKATAPADQPDTLQLPPLPDEALAALVCALAESGVGVVGLTAQTKSLEDIFLSLTQTSGEVA